MLGAAGGVVGVELVEYPSSQSVQLTEPASDDDPRGQLVHLLEPLTDFVPAGQTEQAVIVPPTENLPPGQNLQEI